MAADPLSLITTYTYAMPARDRPLRAWHGSGAGESTGEAGGPLRACEPVECHVTFVYEGLRPRGGRK